MKTKGSIIQQLLTVLWLLAAHAVAAQQAPQYTQYIFNELAINPAYAGSKGILNINATHRSQWTGLEGAPATQSLTVDGPTRHARLGWGANLVNDAIGVQRQMGMYGNVAVRLEVSATARLALGLAGGVAQYTLDGSKLKPGSVTPDAAVPQGRESELLPDARIGLFFNTERFYAGLTAASLIPFRSGSMLIATPQRHYFLSSGYMFDLSARLRLKPSFLLKEDFRGPANVDINTFLLLGDRFWVGASYRTALPVFTRLDMTELQKRNACAFLTQIYVTPKLRIGYSYDMPLTQLRHYPSHEVSVGYSFLKKQDGRILTPRNL